MDNIKGISVVWLSKVDLTNLNSGEGESNYIDVKKYKIDGVEYPYVSGQAMRYYLKEAIRRNLDNNEFMCVPDDKGETCANIDSCIGCDLFGFMTTQKGSKRGEGGALTRVSPVKVSPAIGLLPFYQNSTVDFLTRRHRTQEIGKLEGDIVNIEIGSNIYKAGISIDVIRVGNEEIISDRSLSFESIVGENESKKRVRKVLESINYLTDYSKQSRLLTDFTPDIIAIALQTRYSHRLQKLFEIIEGRKLNVKRVRDVLQDLRANNDKIFMGLITGVIENEGELIDLLNEMKLQPKTPFEAINEAIKEIV
ncbi:type I-B CRISPR-associated protein Cas7/Cst2/DevR [Methanosarcina thermophila MST-A1]|jgi:CRISPR-associated protein Cst2|uniref:CRISPR-associated regulatory protein, DevR family n=1 Tax=Methanosarcina thermophila TaxID=2210 RepID=A0A3G9CVX6_METTE|nr:type I-B CRISPR-associated protein Cas7/Cst2/DevR [Methanosarcina thermophila]BAW29310.1 CRISPR-associated regulatory protein, DevR family [Methanosarcina thermophila]GLI13643.1 type I-B CRISPR-associated protein Cas7/Cst2/DevR [Methanosarcina thermophila MST-A1]HOA68037.1 type I-B CRISPR-associated protein Cas7/Cst2/DevR [Methanosarcina thermophila]HPZ19608.1 type I-B CRISPR-associated protein Cas7/Cst2/DevR [Methanosarcina thermophila]HQD93997.1 type I-B CRISPR-associated protein Cas7/Cst